MNTPYETFSSFPIPSLLSDLFLPICDSPLSRDGRMICAFYSPLVHPFTAMRSNNTERTLAIFPFLFFLNHTGFSFFSPHVLVSISVSVQCLKYDTYSVLHSSCASSVSVPLPLCPSLLAAEYVVLCSPSPDPLLQTQWSPLYCREGL